MTPLRSVLVVVPAYPWPPSDGGRLLLSSRLRALHDAGLQVGLVALVRPDEALGASPVDAWVTELVVVRRPPPARVLWRAPSVPYQATSRCGPAAHQAVAATMQRLQCEVAVFEHTYTAPLRAALPRGVPAVVGVNNLEADALRARAAAVTGAAARVAYRVEALRMARFEGRLFGAPDVRRWLFLSTDECSRAVAAHPSIASRALVVPPGTELPAAVPHDGRPATLAFIGSLWYDPNIEGLRWFLASVWPRVRAAEPRSRLIVAGRRPSAALGRELRAHDGVDFRGEVASVDEVYAEARAVVLPVRLGAGVKLKTIEALGRGRPVVATSHALAGLEVESSRVALVADEAEGFAVACLEALSDMPTVRERAAAARAWVQAHCTWAAVGRRFVAALEGAAGMEPT